MSRRWIIITVSVILITFVGGAWAMLANREDAAVEEVKQLADRLFGDQRGQIPEAQRSALFDQFRQAADQLTSEQRRAVFADRRRGFMERIERYHELPPQERVAYLDSMIDQMEERGRGGGGRGRQRGNRDRGNRPPPTEEQRDQRRRSRLDNSTPEQRAQMAAFFEAMRERREERGMDPMPWPRRR